MLTKSALIDERTKRVIKHYALGGAALGGTAALFTSLLNYFHHKTKEEERDKEDDDTLYVYQKPQEKAAGVDVGLAIPVAAMTTLGTYLLGKELYTGWKASEAQKKLDEAQKIFLETEGYTPIGNIDAVKQMEENKRINAILRDFAKLKSKSQEKKAADGRSADWLENLTSLPVAVPLLLALGTGVAANKFLELKYPVKKPKVKAPRRIEVYNSPNPEETEEEKSASIRTDVGEFMIRTFLMEKSAGVSDIRNVVRSLATGGRRAFCKAASDIGFVNALDTVKGASERKADPFMEHLAIMYLCKSASLAPQTFAVAVGEFAEKYPTIMKQAANLSEDQQDFLLDLTRAMGAAVRSEITEEFLPSTPGESIEKVAAIEVRDMLEKALDASSMLDNENVVKGITDSDAETTPESGDDNEEEKKKKKRVKIVGSKTSKQILMDLDPDTIDKILMPPSNS